MDIWDGNPCKSIFFSRSSPISKLDQLPQTSATTQKKKIKNLGFLGRGFCSHLRLGGICTSPALKMHQRNLKLENLKISKISNSRNQKKLPECFIFPLQCIDLTRAGAGDINMKVASLLNSKNVQFTSLSGNPETKIEKVEEYEF